MRFLFDDGIVVVKVREGIVGMEVDDVSPKLQERLGTEGTLGLLALFETSRKEWTDDVTATAVERIERRIMEESAAARVNLGHTEAKLRTDIGDMGAKLRVEVAELGSALRVEIAELGSALRAEMAQHTATLRTEMAELGSTLRRDMADFARRDELAALRYEMRADNEAVRNDVAQLGTDLRREMSDLRFSVVKWNFVFWTGQLLVTAALMGVFLQAVR